MNEKVIVITLQSRNTTPEGVEIREIELPKTRVKITFSFT